MSKVSLDTIKPWIIQRVNQLLGIEDDVVTDFIFNMLESNQVRRGRGTAVLWGWSQQTMCTENL